MTNNTIPGKWISAHLYYNEPLNTFIQQGVYECIKKIKRKKFADQYFFIRYWENGPHIRLRLRVSDNNVNKVTTILNEYFNEYFTLHPSYRNEFQLQFTDWFPNNSIHFIDYVPETERYGGDKGVQLAEHLFHASSETVLQLMGNIDNWTYDHSIYFAIKMHVVLIKNLHLTDAEIVNFSEYCFSRWINLTVKSTSIPGADGENEKQKLLQVFESSYQKQEEILQELVETTQQEIESGEFTPPFFKDWLFEVSQFADKFHELLKNDHIKVTPSPYFVLPNEVKEYWILFDSYIHMTNNRLGVFNRDESFIYYLLWKLFY